MIVFLEGADKSGKSTFAEKWKDDFEIIHLDNPHKKYKAQGTMGLDLYVQELSEQLLNVVASGKDVMFDRSFYTEDFGYPEAYNRTKYIDADSIDLLEGIVGQEKVVKLYFTGGDSLKEHFARCKAHKEPITESQLQILRLTGQNKSLEHMFHQVDFDQAMKFTKKHLVSISESNVLPVLSKEEEPKVESKPKVEVKAKPEKKTKEPVPMSTQASKLDKIIQEANLLNDLLNKRILPNKPEYVLLESQIKDFLASKLKSIFEPTPAPATNTFSSEEVVFLKMVANNLKEKAEKQK